jgi:hypothetical protein
MVVQLHGNNFADGTWMLRMKNSDTSLLFVNVKSAKIINAAPSSCGELEEEQPVSCPIFTLFSSHIIYFKKLYSFLLQLIYEEVDE